MIELILQDFFKEHCKYPVYFERTEGMKPPFVLIQKTGGSIENFISHSLITAQSYGVSMSEAVQVNKAVQEIMFSLGSHPEIGRVKLNSNYYFPLLRRKEYRYQAVYEIAHY